MEQIFRLGPVSSAARAKRILSDKGIRGRITKTNESKEGCVWGIAVIGKDAERAAIILRTEGVSYEAL